MGPQDFLSGNGLCGFGKRLGDEQGRCGFGPRLPMLVISPYAEHNYIDHTLTSQTSIIRFVEDNWGLPRIPGSSDSISGPINNMFDFGQTPGKGSTLVLDPTTGEPFSG